MSKTEQKYQFLAAMHEVARQYGELGQQLEQLFFAYWANGFGPGGANEITEQEAGVNNFTLGEIEGMMTVCEQGRKFFIGEAPIPTNVRDITGKARMTFLD